MSLTRYQGLPWWLLSGKESSCQCRRCGFDPSVGKIPWSRKWQPTPVFLPGKFHAQRCLAGCRPWGRREPDTAEQTHSTQPDARYTEGATQLPAGSQQSPASPGRARQGKEALFFLTTVGRKEWLWKKDSQIWNLWGQSGRVKRLRERDKSHFCSSLALRPWAGT